jgi:nitroreductase
LILPHTDDPGARERAQYDLGQATMAMMFAAADLGIGSGQAAVADRDLARRLLGFPDDRYAAYLIDLGYPADRPYLCRGPVSSARTSCCCWLTSGVLRSPRRCC